MPRGRGTCGELRANTDDTVKEDGADTPPSASHISVALHLPGSGEGVEYINFGLVFVGSSGRKCEGGLLDECPGAVGHVFDTPETFLIHVPLPGAKKEDIEVNWDPKAVELSKGHVNQKCLRGVEYINFGLVFVGSSGRKCEGGLGGHASFGQPHFGGPSSARLGRGGFEAPHMSHGPWAFRRGLVG
jgi:hypothetical protein